MRPAETFKAFEAASWGAKAPTYDRLTGRVTAHVVEPLLDAAAVGAGARVLDLATGTGSIAAAAAARGAAVVGVDLAYGMIEVARARHPEVDFRRGDAEHLRFEDAAFDAVVAGFVFNHLPSPERAAAECARALVPGGRLALAVWDEPERSRFLSVLVEAVAVAGLETAGEVPGGPDPYMFAPIGYKRACGLPATTRPALVSGRLSPAAASAPVGDVHARARRVGVVEVDRPARPAPRNGAKSDELDAIRVAH